MSDNPFLALIEGLNTDDSTVATTTPEDYAAELSLWTNAEFTFDIPPGFEDPAVINTVSYFGGQDQLLLQHQQSQQQQQQHDPMLGHMHNDQSRQIQTTSPSTLDIFNLTTSQEFRPLSLLERSRQRNPVNGDRSDCQQQQKEGEEKQASEPGARQLAIKDSNSNSNSNISITETTDQKPLRSDNTSSVSTSVLDTSVQEISKDEALSNMSKLTPEEDKRRRNTVASARFRLKKKLREQVLEQTALEQTTRAEKLEAHVRELEMEVRWLRGLIVEKDSRLHEATVSLYDTNKRVRLDESD
ncbi:hypothetical protein BX616_003407 [Lobosporangium transversale]|nr:hypothetical protein BX616_003407 [Lobosporangium transversale]